MEKRIKTLSISYLITLVMIFMSGLLSGILAEVVYYLAFILPFALAILLFRKEKGNFKALLSIDREGLEITAVCLFPCISLILIISVITSYFLYFTTGATNDVHLGDSLFLAIIIYALIPAVLEEILFRYLPMRLLKDYPKKLLIFISSFFFALIHHSIFSIPYAFLAGIVFMTLNLMTDSVIPSIILHFVNNCLSVLIIFCPEAPVTAVISVLTAVSLYFVFLGREKYKERLITVISGEAKIKLTSDMVIFAIITVGIAITELIGGGNG